MRDLLLLTLIVVYIVDLSGFTESWKGLLWKVWKLNTKDMKPFDCSLCMTWWVGLIYLLIVGKFTMGYIAAVAALSFLSFPIGQILIFIREGLTFLVGKMMSLL